MSLYGALFSGVSGLQSQSSAMGAISDNITNVNTIGYKGTNVNFQTLVTSQVATSEYSPGGVQSKPRAGIDVQGLLQSTNSSSDVALSGQGFFVVNSAANPKAEGGSFSYTRAGSFKPNKDGYLQNAAGFYLQGWPLTPTDNSPAAVPGQSVINGTTFMKAYKNSDGTFHYINQNIINTSEVQPLNLNTIGGTSQPTSNVSMGANLPSGDPVYDPNHPELGGVHTTNILTYDSLGNTGNAQFTWTKSGANAWTLAGTPPSGSAVLNLTNYSTANGNLIYGSQGQLEFNSIPVPGAYFQLGPTSAKATNPTVQVQFYNSGVSGSSDPTADTPATINGQANVSILGVDLNGVTNTNQLTSAIQSTIKSAANSPSVKKTYTIAATLLGGVANGASRFVADSSVLRIVQEPKAAAVVVNCATNATTLLGNSITQSGTGVGSSVQTPGIFTVPAVYDGGSVTNTATYGAYSTTAESQTMTVASSLGNSGTKSFTINPAIAAAPAGGTAAFTITTSKGTLTATWAAIASGTTAGATIAASFTPTGGVLGAITISTTGMAATANTAATLAQNVAVMLQNAGTTRVPAAVSASYSGGVVTITNANDTTTSGTPVTTSIIPDSTGTTATDITWNDGTAGTTAETASSSGLLQIGKIQIPWSQINSGTLTSYVTDGITPATSYVGPYTLSNVPVAPNLQTMTIATVAPAAPTGNFQMQSSAGTLSIAWSDIKAGSSAMPITFTTTAGATSNLTVNLGSALISPTVNNTGLASNLKSILGDINMTTYVPASGFSVAQNVATLTVASTVEAVKITADVGGGATDVTVAGNALTGGTTAYLMGSLSAAQSAQNAVSAVTQLTSQVTGGVTATPYTANAPTAITLNSGATAVQIFANNGGTAKDILWTNGVDASLASNAQVLGQTGIYNSASGQAVTFNGDGTPSSIIPNAMQLYWANGSENQVGTSGSSTLKPQISLNMGSLNQSNGLTQLGGNYQVNYLSQNGAKFGNFSGVSIGSDGVVTALFDNGVRSPVFQIPIATFANPDGMQSQSGDVFIDTSNSGAYTLRHPGEAGSGTVAASSLEASTVDIGTEFTNMITVQNAYSAAAKIITTTNQLLTDLINIKQ